MDSSDDQGFTGLQMAAANGHEELVRLMIMRGAALDKCNQYEWTPLLHAARHGHTGALYIKYIYSSIIVTHITITSAENVRLDVLFISRSALTLLLAKIPLWFFMMACNG